MNNLKVDGFTLNTYLIPDLRSEGIRFQFVDSVDKPMKMVVIHKDFDVCLVEIIQELHTEYSYKVTWAHPRNGACYYSRYRTSIELTIDIKNAIRYLENRREDKMNEKMYRVTDVKIESGNKEITFTVNVSQSHDGYYGDANRIRNVIESIGANNEYHGGFTTWRNEYQKERDKFGIKDAIFNNPATIVLWEDGTKTVVKAENEEFDPEKGLAMAIAKKALGNNYDYYDIFKKYVGRYEKKNKKG